MARPATASGSAPPSVLNDLLMQRRTPTRRPLLRRRLRDASTEEVIDHDARHPEHWTGSTPRPRSRRRSAGSRTATCCSSAATFVEGRGDDLDTINPAPASALATVSTGQHGRRRRRRRRGPDGVRQGLVTDVAAPNAASTCSGSPAASPSGPGNSPSSRPWTTASRSRNPATSTCRPPRRTSSTTPAGPTSCSTLGFGPSPQPLGRRRPGDPVELPAADGGLEDRPGAGRRQHRGDQTRRDDAVVDPGAGRDHRRRRPAAGRGQHRHRGRRHRRRAGQPSRASTRSPSPARPTVGRQIQSRLAGTGRKLTLELGGKARQHRLRRRRRSTRPSRASSTGSSSTRARCAAPDPGCWCRNRSPTRSSSKLRARIATLRLGDPMDKNTDVGAINSAAQLATITALADAGEAEGAERWTSPCPLPGPRLLLRADGLHPGRRSRCGSPGRRSSGRCCPC